MMTMWIPSGCYRLYQDRNRTERVGETLHRAEAEAAPHVDQMWIRPVPGWSKQERRPVPCGGFEAAWLPFGSVPRVGVVNLEHARDIPDDAFCRAISTIREHGRWPCVSSIASELEKQGFFSVPIRSGQPQDAVPWKLVLAKARRLIGRGLIDGCPCGCRGDFELTDAGRTLTGSGQEVSCG